MQFAVTYPIVSHQPDPEFLTGGALTQFCRTAERVGFDGIGFTDHPAPTHRWLNAGGHDALDPFVAFAYCAAVTERLRLIPNILVLPYRNPFLVAKAAATIDALSGGRFILAVATGYLRGEYRALGVDFDERNDLFDEAIAAIQGVWTTDDFAYAGRHFEAPGQSVNPKPSVVPPIWIGGNSRLSRRRVAAVADGWSPFPAARTLATTAKTPPLETLDDLATMIEELWQFVDEAGRDRTTIDISCPQLSRGTDRSQQSRLDSVAELGALGVTWTSAAVPGASLAQALEALEDYGTNVIGPLQRDAAAASVTD